MAPLVSEERAQAEAEERKARSQATTAQALVDLWHTRCPSLPRCVGLSPNRRKKAALRFQEHPDLAWWARLFDGLEVTPFCKGDNDRGWEVKFDWLMTSPDNLLKAQEWVARAQRRAGLRVVGGGRGMTAPTARDEMKRRNQEAVAVDVQSEVFDRVAAK